MKAATLNFWYKKHGADDDTMKVATTSSSTSDFKFTAVTDHRYMVITGLDANVHYHFKVQVEGTGSMKNQRSTARDF